MRDMDAGAGAERASRGRDPLDRDRAAVTPSSVTARRSRVPRGAVLARPPGKDLSRTDGDPTGSTQEHAARISHSASQHQPPSCEALLSASERARDSCGPAALKSISVTSIRPLCALSGCREMTDTFHTAVRELITQI